MKGFVSTLVAILVVSYSLPAGADSGEPYDYFASNREHIRNGVQAVLMCNGLFTSERDLEQVFAQELAYMERFGGRVGTPDGGDWEVDEARRAVRVGHGRLAVRAAYRPGIACVVLGPEQSFDDIDSLPRLDLPSLKTDPDLLPWPEGDWLPPVAEPAAPDALALQAASDWAFERESIEQDTISLLVVHRGQIVHERYADGFSRHTRTRTWSTAKSIASVLIGMLVDQGKLSLDGSLKFDWLPELPHPEADPRHAVSLRHLLHMSSGLEPVDSFNREYATGSGLAYWAGYSSVQGALARGLVRTPGTAWEYENYDTLLAVYAMKQALGSEQEYLEFPYRALLHQIGMRNTLLSTDRFGDFILSSQVYTNARDLARFGLMLLNNGRWNGERLLSEEWIRFVREPAPATVERGGFYGGHFWLVPADRHDVPADAYLTRGNRGQYLVVIPSHDLLIVRRGLDFGAQGFDPWDLTREVLKAFSVDSVNT